MHFPLPSSYRDDLSEKEKATFSQVQANIDSLALKSPTLKKILLAATQDGTKPLTIKVGQPRGPTASYNRANNEVTINKSLLSQGADHASSAVVFEMINAARISSALRVGQIAKTGYFTELAQTLSTPDKQMSAGSLYARALETSEYHGISVHHTIYEENRAAGVQISKKADMYGDNFDPALGANYACLHEYLALMSVSGHTSRYAEFYERAIEPHLNKDSE